MKDPQQPDIIDFIEQDTKKQAHKKSINYLLQNAGRFCHPQIGEMNGSKKKSGEETNLARTLKNISRTQVAQYYAPEKNFFH